MGRSKYIFSLLGAVLGSCSGFVHSAPVRAPSTKSMVALMDQGKEALLAGDYKAARDAFSDILTADPRNEMALEGSTLAYLQLGDYQHAKADLEKAGALSTRSSRAKAINGAAIYVHTKNTMRAVKLLIDYMTPMKSVDEAALNALAICLNVADDQSRKSGLYSSAVNFYSAQNKKLEETRTGTKRWGTQWLPADEADQKNAAWLASQTSTAKLGRELAALKAHLAVVVRNQNDPVFAQQAQIQEYQRTYGMRRAEVPPLQELNLPRLQPVVDAKQAEYDKLTQNIEKPPIPDSFSPVEVFNGEDTIALANARTGVVPRASTPTPSSAPVAVVPPPRRPAQVASGESNRPPTEAVGTGTPTPPPDSMTTPDVPATERKMHRVTSYAAAFPVGTNLLVTSADAVADATEIQVQVSDGAAFAATVVRSDPQSGLALLSVPTAKFARLGFADQYMGGTLSCVSFPTVDLFQPSAALIAGSATMPKGAWHVHLSETPRLGGGPLLSNGKVIGVELATRDSDITAIPAVSLEDLKKFLAADLSTSGVTGDGVAATVQLMATREK